MGSTSILISVSVRPFVVAWVVAVLSAQPGCSLIGAGAGFAIGSGGPGPYEQQPLIGADKVDVHSLQRLDVAPGNAIQVLMKSGTLLEGEYVRVDAPTARDPETYLVLEGSDERRGLEYLPLSEVESIGVEVVEYGWIGVGAAAGFVLDILFFIGLSGWAEGLSS